MNDFKLGDDLYLRIGDVEGRVVSNIVTDKYKMPFNFNIDMPERESVEYVSSKTVGSATHLLNFLKSESELNHSEEKRTWYKNQDYLSNGRFFQEKKMGLEEMVKRAVGFSVMSKMIEEVDFSNMPAGEDVVAKYNSIIYASSLVWNSVNKRGRDVAEGYEKLGVGFNGKDRLHENLPDWASK